MNDLQPLCAFCGASLHKPASALNRASAIGAKLYCGRKCVGFARRIGKSAEQRKAEKAAYDKARREALGEALKQEKRTYYFLNRGRFNAEQAERRAQPGYQERHNEYCRRPEYRVYKSDYDRHLRAKKQFGEFAEAFLILQDVEREVLERATRYEIGLANGTINKAQTRRRALA